MNRPITTAIQQICLIFALSILASGCRDLNPAFKLDSAEQDSTDQRDNSLDDESQSDADTESTSSTTGTTSQRPSKSTQAPSQSSDDTSSSSETTGFVKSPLCQDEHELCFSMQENQDGEVIDEQEQAMKFAHYDTSVTPINPDADPPWNQLLNIEKHGASAYTGKALSIDKNGILGVEVVAKDLSCDGFSTQYCPLVAINGYLSINYNDTGLIECEARYQGKAIPGRTKLRVELDPKVSPLRALCWSDGDALMFWANGKYTEQIDLGGLLATEAPTELIIGGRLPDLTYAAVKGSIALIRIWSDVRNLKEKLEANPKL